MCQESGPGPGGVISFRSPRARGEAPHSHSCLPQASPAPGIGPVPQSPRRVRSPPRRWNPATKPLRTSPPQMGLHTPPRPGGQAGSLRVWASVWSSRIQMQVQPPTSAASSPATTGQRTSQSKPAGDRSQVSARKVTTTQVSLSLQARRLQPLCPSWSSEGAESLSHRRSVPPLWLRLSKAGILPVNHWCPQCERPLGRQPMAVDDIGSWWGAVRVDLQAVALSHE